MGFPNSAINFHEFFFVDGDVLVVISVVVLVVIVVAVAVVVVILVFVVVSDVSVCMVERIWRNRHRQ